MLFRTILLWLSFILLILQYFIEVHDVLFGFVYRLLPSALLLLWFLLSIFTREKVTIDPKKVSRPLVRLFQVMRPLASLTIVLGAIFKIMHWPFGDILLVSGIGFMAVYSSILYLVFVPKNEYDPNVVDDLDE